MFPRHGIHRDLIHHFSFFGQLASEHAATLAYGNRVELEYDQANAATQHKDRYGPHAGVRVGVEHAARRAFCVNEWLIWDGYANAYTNYPFKYSEKYLQLQREARERGLGLWSPDLDLSAAGAGEDGDKNCSNFTTHAEAQAFYLALREPSAVHETPNLKESLAVDGTGFCTEAPLLRFARASAKSGVDL